MKQVGLVVLALTLTGYAVNSAPQAAINVTIASRAVAPGEVLVLTIRTQADAVAVTVTGFNREFPVFRERAGEWRSLVGLDLDVKPGPHILTIAAGPAPRERINHRILVTTKAFATRTLSVDPAFVEPPPEAVARIQADSARLNRAYGASAKERLWAGVFVRPVTAAANSAFGTRSVFNGQSRNPHSGADFASPAGTPVRAPNAGRVVVAGDLYFTGNTVLIDHGLGLFSLFAHLDSIDVREGDPVVTGQFVGNVGRTGRVTGPHLHWSVRLNDARVDPLSLLAALGKARQ